MTDPRHDDQGSERIDQLVMGAAGDQPAAWEALVDRLTQVVWSVCRSSGLPEREVELATVVTWLRLVDRLGEGRPRSVTAWLAHVAYEETARVQRLRALQGDPADVAQHEHGRPAPVGDPDAELLAAFERLTPRCRLLIRLLLTADHLRYREISAAVGIPIGSIGPTRQRCLAKLQLELRRADHPV